MGNDGERWCSSLELPDTIKERIGVGSNNWELGAPALEVPAQLWKDDYNDTEAQAFMLGMGVSMNLMHRGTVLFQPAATKQVVHSRSRFENGTGLGALPRAEHSGHRSKRISCACIPLAVVERVLCPDFYVHRVT